MIATVDSKQAAPIAAKPFVYPPLHRGDWVEVSHLPSALPDQWHIGQVITLKHHSCDIRVDTAHAGRGGVIYRMDCRHIDDPSIYDPKRRIRTDSGVFKPTKQAEAVQQALAETAALREEIAAIREIVASLQTPRAHKG